MRRNKLAKDFLIVEVEVSWKKFVSVWTCIAMRA